MRFVEQTQPGTRALIPVIGVLVALGAVGLATACESDNNFTNIVPGTQAVATFKDDTFNFTTLQTFVMPDSVVHFEPVTGTPLSVTRQFDAVALARVRQNFLARGYTEQSNPRVIAPNFVVLVGASAQANYNAWVSYSWFSLWGFFPGWGFFTPGFTPAWGINFPWFASVGVTAYARGTLVVTLIPTTSIDPVARRIQAAWAGVATALLDSRVDDNAVAAAVDEMFRQSPYLIASAPTFTLR
jgi:hypothetical protein